jgi:hypothetical protein
MSDLKLAIRYGWRYEWVRDLDADVHAVLIDELLRELAEADR